jgi:hypothetical protein
MKDKVIPAAALLQIGHPSRSDDDDHRLTGGNCVFDGLGEILSGNDILYVHEDVLEADIAAEMFRQSAGIACRILPPIA